MDASAQEDVRQFKLFEGRNLVGGDYRKSKPGKVSLDKCEAACKAVDECKAYSYDTAKKVCFLKGDVTRFKKTTSSVSGILTSIEPPPGWDFRDCSDCPEMVVVPAGSFTMGSTKSDSYEKPPHPVTIAQPFAIGKFEVTWAEWDACVSAGGCDNSEVEKTGGDEGWGRGNRPVINVSWNDVKSYVKWLSGKTGQDYRLLTEAEWEYAARAGSETKYSWGNAIGKNKTNCDGCGSPWDNKKTAPVGSFRTNAFGLYDMHGNVWEWVEDCWRGSYTGAPKDGRAWTTGSCDDRVLRGGSWDFYPRDLRSANRDWMRPVFRKYYSGFRVARSLP